MKGQSKYSMPTDMDTSKVEEAALQLEMPIYAIDEGFSLRGLSRVLGLSFASGFLKKIFSKADIIPLIREGLPKRSLDQLQENTGLSNIEIADIIHTSDRTLRRYTASQRLNPEQSERIIEVARLYNRGEEVFGSMDSFKEWMNTEVISLGNVKPKTLLDTSLGIGVLMEELGKIEHGIFA